MQRLLALFGSLWYTWHASGMDIEASGGQAPGSLPALYRGSATLTTMGLLAGPAAAVETREAKALQLRLAARHLARCVDRPK